MTRWQRPGKRPLVVLLLLALIGAAVGYLVRQRWLDALLREGEQALANREFGRASELLDRYLASRPNDAQAHLLAARAARRRLHFDEASEHLRLSRRRGGPADAIDAEFALIDLQRGDETPLAGLRRRASAGDELGLWILETVIQHDLNTYRLTPALHGLTLYLEHRPNDLQARLGRGYVWERFIYYPDALEDYRKAVEAHPDSAAARRRLADTLLISGTPGEALTQYEWLAERHPDDLEIRLGLARCHRRLGRSEQARPILERLLADRFQRADVYLELGQIDLEQGRLAQAEKALREAFRLNPHDRQVSYALWRCLLALNQPKEAATFRERMERIDADLKQLDQIRRAVMKRPDDVALRCEGARLFLRNGETQEGLRWLRLALHLDPDCEPARQMLAEHGER